VNNSAKCCIACRNLATAQKLASGFPRIRTISLDVANQSQLDTEVSTHQLVISLIPYTYHTLVIESAIKAKVNVVTTSYVSPPMRKLEPAVKEAGIVVMNEVGVDPGVDHLYAIKIIEEVHEKGGKVSLIHHLLH
jgi:saccharopine dehydrogenase-like NADP-dependent oxidoreductase